MEVAAHACSQATAIASRRKNVIRAAEDLAVVMAKCAATAAATIRPVEHAAEIHGVICQARALEMPACPHAKRLISLADG